MQLQPLSRHDLGAELMSRGGGGGGVSRRGATFSAGLYVRCSNTWARATLTSLVTFL